MVVIDAEGYRANVGIIISNASGQVLWAKRVGAADAWQFPQGGINQGESPKQAMYRELHEEVGLTSKDVNIVAVTRGWLNYKLPAHLVRENQSPKCIGQKQKWFLLKLVADDSAVTLDQSHPVEFDGWRWVSYWYPVEQVVPFKRDVYCRALKELSVPHSQIEVAFERQATQRSSSQERPQC